MCCCSCSYSCFVPITVVAVVGDDPEADKLRSALRDASIDVDGLVTDTSRPTTVKRSLIGLAQHRHPQKMFRVDFESREPIAGEVEQRLGRYRVNPDPDRDAREAARAGLVQLGKKRSDGTVQRVTA